VIARKIDKQEQIVASGDMSGDITSSVVELAAYRNQAIQAVWTGSPVGNIQMEVSNDGTNWFVQGSPVAAGGSAGTAMFTVQFAPWAKSRLFFDFTSGTGVLNAFSIVKE
jgi:hypothetical protein